MNFRQNIQVTILYTGVDTSYPPNISFPKPFDEYKNPSIIRQSLLDGFYNQLIFGCGSQLGVSES